MITCKRIVHAEDGDRLLAYCYRRRSDRTFLLDRIIEAANHGSGECIPDLRAFFAPYQETAGELSDDHGTTRKVLTEIGDELRILAFIAKADMSLHRAEDQVTLMFVRHRAEDLRHEVSANYDHAKVMEADGTVLPEELDRLHELAQAVDHALSELRKDN